MQDGELPLIRDRKCCACGEPQKRLSIAGIYWPAEQWNIPAHKVMEESTGVTIKPWGQTSIHEFYFLCFKSICKKCGHIDFWDVPTKEITAIIEKSLTNNSEGYGIDWATSPENIKLLIEKSPELYKKDFIALQAALGQAKTNE